MSSIPSTCIERGEGVVVWDVEIPSPPQPTIQSSGPTTVDDIEPLNIVTLFRPVRVDVNDDGEPYAYYYGTTQDFETEMKTGGKIYVEPDHVHVSPPKMAILSSKFDVEGPNDDINRDDVPEHHLIE